MDVESWVCPECRCAAKKGGNNSSTPVGYSKKAHDSSNITFRKKLHSDVEMEQSRVRDNGEMLDEMRSMKREMMVLQQTLQKCISIIKHNETKIEHYVAKMESLENKLVCYELSNSPLVAKLTAEVEKHSNKVVSPHNNDKAENCDVNIATSQNPVLNKDKLGTKGAKKKIIPTQPPHTTDITASSSQASKSNKSNKSESSRKQNTTVVSNVEVVLESGAPISHTQDDKWTEVQRKRPRRSAPMCGTAGPNVTTLKAVEPRKYLHLWNMVSNAEDVSKYLRILCPDGSCTVEELKPKGDYKSYKLGVPEAYYDTCFSVDVWPINAKIKAWITFKKTVGLRNPQNNNQPFRSHPGTQ